VPKRALPSSFAPGSEVASATPGATRSGFTRPSNASPREEKGATSPELPLSAMRGTPIEIAGRSCRRTAAAARPPYPRRQAQHRHVDALVEAEPACRQLRAVEHDGGGSRARCVLGCELRVVACVDESGPARDQADPVAVEKLRQLRPARLRRRRPRRGELEFHGARRNHGSSERERPVEQQVEARAYRHLHLLGLRTQVGRADRERIGRAARAGNAAIGGAGRPVVPDRCDHERVETKSAADRPRLGRVGEGTVGGGDADQRDPGGVVRVAVDVRVDRALEPCNQLIGPCVDGPAPGEVGLPAGDADRQHRSARRDAGDPARAACADEDAGHLGPVVLDPSRAARVDRGGRVVAAVDNVDPPQHPSAQVRLAAVDAGVEERNRDAAAVVARQRHRR